MNRFLSLLLLAILFPLILAAQEWESIGPYGGSGLLIVEDTSTGGIYLAGRSSLYRLDSGQNVWQRLTDPAPFLSQQVTRMSAADGDLLVSIGCCSFFHSMDGGESWREVAIDTVPLLWYTSVVALRDTLYIAGPGSSTDLTLYHSLDNGGTWSRVGPLNWPTTSAMQLSSDGNQLVIMAQDGLYRRWSSSEWSRFTNQHRSVALYAEGNLLFYVFEDDLDRSYMIHRSLDHGSSWKEFADVSRLTPFALHDDTLWMASSMEVLASASDKREWVRQGVLGDRPQHPITLHWTGRGLIEASGTGTYRWEDAEDRFIPFDTGRSNLSVSQIFGIGDTLFVPGYRLYLSGDEGRSWIRRPGPLGFGLYHMTVRGDRLFCISRLDSIYRSDDHGLTWSSKRCGDSTLRVYPDFFYVLDEAGETMIASGNGGAVRSTDGGTTWQQLTLPSEGGFFTASGTGDTIIARMLDAQVQLTLSTDHGATWSAIELAEGSPAVALAEYGNDLLYLRTIGGGLKRSSDLGETWTSLTLPSIDTTIALFNSFDIYGDTLFVSLSEYTGVELRHHLFVSLDRGDRWKALAPPAGDVITSAGEIIAILYPYKGRFLAGTHSSSIYQASLTLDTPDDRLAGRSNDIARIVFDPARDLVTWSMSTSRSYRLDLYTLTGEHIALIADGEANGGMHALPLDDLPAGAYLCVLHSGGESAAVVVTAR